MITIYPADIPEEGLHLSGSITEDIFQLDPKDEIQPAGPSSYDLRFFLTDDCVVAEGTIESPFKLTCVSCLETFPFTCRDEDYQTDFELEGAKQLELTERLREDFLLGLPAYPHCDQGDNPDRICPMAGKFEAPEPTSDSDEKPSAWDALDGLGAPVESGD